MKYRRFGRTELQMPVLTCGGMRYQHSWQDEPPEKIPEENQANLESTVRRALELGINHIETARGYGTSEFQLGRLLPHLPREQLIVQTKIAPTDTAAEFLKIFERSLECLQLGHLDLLSLHGINNAEVLEQALRPGGSLAAIEKLRAQGRIRFVGFSTHGPCDVIVRAIQTGAFDYVNLHWYFVNDFNWPAVLAARAQDMGVFIISPNDKGGKLYEPPAKLVELCRPLSPMIFNDLYCLARPEVHTLSIGASRPGDFDEHIAALEFYDRAAEMAAPIEQRLRNEMARILGVAWTNGWWRNLPEHTEAPGGINLLEILRLWSLAKALDLGEFARMRYNLLGNAGHWFPGQKAAEFSDDEIKACLCGHPFADRIPGILREAHQMLNAEPQKRLSES
jgi:predicted aldo/keto reductase-like oxidoreductase